MTETLAPSAPVPTKTAIAPLEPIRVRAKFFFEGDQKFFIKGVTYGAFRPNDAGVEFHDPGKIRRLLSPRKRNLICPDFLLLLFDSVKVRSGA